jgi:hypothetical protein
MKPMRVLEITWFSFLKLGLAIWAVSIAGGAYGSDVKTPYLVLADEIDSMIDVAIAREERIDEQKISDLLDHFLAKQLLPVETHSIHQSEIELAYRAALGANSVAPDITSQLVELVNRVGGLLQDQGSSNNISSVDPFRETYERLVNARDFEAARKFAAHYQIEEPTWVRDFDPTNEAGRAAYLDFDRVDGVVTAALREVDLGNGNWMIVEVHPDCGFSRSALEYIRRNEEIVSGVPRDRVLWVVSQSRGQALPSMLRWNDSNPGMEMVLVYKNEDWPQGISFLEFPVFNFVRDGRVVKKVRGWPGDNQAELIREGARIFGNL